MDDATDDATITLPALDPVEPIAIPVLDDEDPARAADAGGGTTDADATDQTPIPPPPDEPPAAAPQPLPRWRRGAAAVAVAVVAGAAAGGVAGRITAPDNHTTVTAAQLGGSGTGTISKPSDIQQVLARIAPAVVSIRTQAYQGGRFFPTEGAGSGIIISDSGEVLTNAHVVNGATSIRVTLNGEKTARTADLLGIDTAHDVALVKIRDAQNLPTATLGSSADLRVGDSVVAIGNALDLGATPSVTEGIVSALNRSIDAPDESLSGLIQTDAAINPGNSGGPLVDAQGRVVGMNTAIAGDAQNIGFAIPIDAAKERLSDLRNGAGKSSNGSNGTTQQANGAFLGVSVEDANGQGALIGQVVNGSPADSAGLQPGDVVTKIDGKDVSSATDLVSAVRSHKPGDKVPITYERNGSSHSTNATLASSSSS